MRKVLWTLGALSAIGFALTVSTAQDRLSGTSPYRSANTNTNTQSRGYAYVGSDSETEPTAGEQETPAEVQRYTRSRSEAGKAQGAGQPQGLKNYQKELFGADASNAKAPAAKQPTNTRMPVRDGQIRQTNGTDSGKHEVRQAGGLMDESESENAVTQADFAKQPGKAEPVKQVSGQKAGSLPAAAEGTGKGNLTLLPDMPPARGAVKKDVAKTPAAKTTTPAAASTKDAGIRKPASLSASKSTGVATNFTSGSPRISTEWKKLSDFNVGQPCSMELVVANSGTAGANDVAVDVFIPTSIRITEAKPEPTAASDHATWRFNSIAAGEERRISLTVIPSLRGEIAANANVRYTSAASTVINVEEPLLKVAITGPEQVSVGEPAAHVVTLSNPGTGVAHNVTLEVNIPAGLEHPKGSRLMMDLGSLTPNENRTVKLSLVAKAGGEQAIRVEAKAGTELHQTAVAKLSVLAPSLKLELAGPAVRYVGRDARYTLNVKNDGATQTNNVRAVYIVPKGFQFISASNGGTFDESNHMVTWFVGSVDAGKTTELTLKLRPSELGDYTGIAKVVSEHGATAEARTQTKVDGAASLVLEVVDLDDPVEVGRETAYEIRVRNDGSKEAQNIGLSIELPTSIQLVSVKAPVEYIAESGLVVFKSLPQLPPGKTGIFQLIVKGRDEGHQRLRARLTSDSIQEPLTVEELTKFYAD
jgi:uncharacterized repeat protein (TIGR01451 family)